MGDVLNVSKMSGRNVLNDAVMKDRLPKSVYKRLKKTTEDGAELNPSTANMIAHAIKDQAIERGVIHYTRWFQPPVGVTTEKHDPSISAPFDGKVVIEFSGEESIRGEPDASSFPSGGLCVTFEARGYTVWDCTSPALLQEDAIDVTLCIPTSLCSYREEALSKKIPLLRSMQAVSEQVLRILCLFGNATAKRVAPSTGTEQEHFLVDGKKYLQRKDLAYTGRTSLGAMPPKGQELEDHYFDAIRERIGSYMNDVNKELWKLGIPTKIQHSEVAPTQHELAPIYEGVNQAIDHNQIVMETLKKVAGRHGTTCLLHEKPFTGISGSGRHDNWSLTGDDDTNLLNPGDTPHENIQLLLVLVYIIEAMDIHADLLRESAPDMGDDHRLGVNEAPPAIISIFLREQLEDVIDQLCSIGETTHPKQDGTLKTGADILPDLNKDATDRSHTSPFAFTGNRFELYMMGSSDSIASLNTVLNAIVVEAFKEVADMLGKTEDFDMVVRDLIRGTLAAYKRVIFNGDGYSDEWVTEVERKGLPNIRSMMGAIPAPTMDKAVKLFEMFGVLIRVELESRSEVEYENYSKAINTKARIMYDMVSKSIIPAVVKYATRLTSSIAAMKGVCQEVDVSTQTELLIETSKLLAGIKAALARLLEVMEKAAAAEGSKVQALVYHSRVAPAMEALRTPVSQLGVIMDKELQPMPSYGGLISEV